MYDDDCLSAVPGSHRRIRTFEEREANLAGGDAAMPGSTVIRLKKGETVFYNNNICKLFYTKNNIIRQRSKLMVLFRDSACWEV